MTRWDLSKNNNLYTKLHFGIVPFAANSTVFTPDTSQFRDYDYCYGLQAQFETTLNLGHYISFTIADYVYYLHTFNAPEPDSIAALGELVSHDVQYPVNGNNL